jgi:hypothetical protein
MTCQFDAVLFLQLADDAEKIPCLGLPRRPNMRMRAFRLCAGHLAELREARPMQTPTAMR